MDPISAKLTESALTNLSGFNTPTQAEPNFKTDQTSFSRVLDNQLDSNQATNSKLLEFVENMTNESTNSTVKAIPADGIQVDVARAADIERNSVTKSSNIFEVFKEVNSSSTNMDQLFEKLSSNAKFSAQDMIRIQLFAQSHLLIYESVSKLAESANKAISGPFNMPIS